jgi:hypothetical protein
MGTPRWDHWQRIGRLQTSIARRWSDAGRELERQAKPESYGGVPTAAFAFIAYFSALNALYWLWSSVDADQLRTSDEPKELKLPAEDVRIAALIDRLDQAAVVRIWENDDVERAVAYFVGHYAVRDMRHREIAEEGDERKGRMDVDVMKTADKGPRGKLKALASTVYRVRCNLVHGSKEMNSTDDQLVHAAIAPLRLLLDAAIAFTDSYRWPT